MNKNRQAWLAFFALSFIWGTSFLFIKIATHTLQPFTLVGYRLLVGWITLFILMKWRNLSLPPRAMWKHFAVAALINTALPFWLFSWAESGPHGVNSGIAALLNGTVPLFTILLAGFLLKLDKVTLPVIIGLVTGFLGILLIFGDSFAVSNRHLLFPLLACTGAALSYAISSVYIKTYIQGVNPLVMAAGQVFLADLYIWTIAFLVEKPSQQTLPWPTIGSILWLGVLGSAVAYIFYFYLLQEWGPTRATLVTYVMPVVGVAAGILFLQERLEWRILLGGLLILSGVYFVNLRHRHPSADFKIKRS